MTGPATAQAPERSVAAALRQAIAMGIDRLDAQLLLLHALGQGSQGRAWLLAHDTDTLPAQNAAQFEQALTRRAQGEPLAYITGRQGFYGLDLSVNASVLVPRADTETLVDWALELLPATSECSLDVLDLGTGSGAIALAIKSHRPWVNMQALDSNQAALAVANQNAAQLGLQIELKLGNWLEGVGERYHLILANPPYIAEADHHLAALRHEPLQALSAGADGLADLRRIIVQAAGCLHAGGWLLLEHGHTQARSVGDLLVLAGFSGVASRRDLAGIERCTGAQLGRDQN